MRISQKLPLALIAATSLLMGVSVASAAAAEGPVWKIMAVPQPTNFRPGVAPGVDMIVVEAINVGGASTGCTTATIESEKLAEEKELAALEVADPGLEKKTYENKLKHAACKPGSPVVSPVTISDSLPGGLTATIGTEKHGNEVGITGLDNYRKPWAHIKESNMQCSPTPTALASCTESNRVDPGDTLRMIVPVSVGAASGSLTNVATVSGGGAASTSASAPMTITPELPAYGVAQGGLLAASSTSQAGAHPNVTTAFFLNTVNEKPEHLGEPERLGEYAPAGAPKDISFDAPPGLVGTSVGVPRCTMAAVIDFSDCPRDTMVGTSTTIFFLKGEYNTITVPVYNIAPAPGEPVAFAFDTTFFSTRLDTSVLSDGDYGVRVTAPDLTAGAAIIANSITLWGVPAEHSGPGPDYAIQQTLQISEKESFDWLSFGGANVEERIENEGTTKVQGQSRVPLLSNPSQCSTPLEGALSTDSWEAQGPGVFTEASTSMGTATGCNLLSFKPGISMSPDTLEAGAPAGYAFDLSLPQNNEAEGLATPDVKRTSVTLPLGTVISPSAADGLGDCTSEQFYGPAGERGQARPATPGSCPRDSQVGTIRVKTPSLEERLTGQVYLGAPECTGVNGTCTPRDAEDGAMIHLYAQFVSEGEDGIVVKLEGKGQINQQTGQITTVFENTPQLPFSELELTLQGGERATLANPRTCGEVHTTADLTPWSTPFTPDASPESNFDVDENCFGTQFNPSFSFGTTSNQAGGFSPFSVSFGRGDDDGFLNGIQVRTPPGLLGMLSKVSLCGEAQANAGTCGPESQIGETTVETGPGADPFLVTGGKVFITGPYKGAPYGLSIVVPAKAGPYTLAGTTGNGTVVNRSAISVNPETSALTVTSDPLPTELDGIPLQLRLVNVTINRPEFIFNATSCNKMAIGGTLTDTQAASVIDSSSYQVTNCGALKFQPKFTVSTSGKTSKSKGASLDARLTYPNTGQGTEADIAKVKVELPKQLPSRLTTLQKACLAQTFAANPANCPAASVIGIVKVSTPVLAQQLTGPVYFVSHGGEAFPSLTVVLQGGGVRVDLTGTTFISKAGITSTTFKTVPDVPFESFELYLPEGPYSALAANGNLCKSSLVLPNEFIAQNGAAIHEKTKVAVTGCPKAKKAVKKKKKAKKKKNPKVNGVQPSVYSRAVRHGYSNGRQS
jgi:hypothetical protein